MKEQSLSEENWKSAVHSALAKLPWRQEIAVKDEGPALSLSIDDEDLGMIRHFRNFHEQCTFWSDEDQEGIITDGARSIQRPVGRRAAH